MQRVMKIGSLKNEGSLTGGLLHMESSPYVYVEEKMRM